MGIWRYSHEHRGAPRPMGAEGARLRRGLCRRVVEGERVQKVQRVQRVQRGRYRPSGDEYEDSVTCLASRLTRHSGSVSRQLESSFMCSLRANFG